MRKTLAAVALATAALGLTAPSASAGCYGVQYVAVACWGGEYNPNPTITQRTVACVYTGGTSCENVDAPWVEVNRPSGRPSVCLLEDPICVP